MPQACSLSMTLYLNIIPMIARSRKSKPIDIMEYPRYFLIRKFCSSGLIIQNYNTVISFFLGIVKNQIRIT